MPMREFHLWQAYLKEYDPDLRNDLRSAKLMAHISNMSGKVLRQGVTVSHEDFLGGRKPQSFEDQIAFLKGINSG